MRFLTSGRAGRPRRGRGAAGAAVAAIVLLAAAPPALATDVAIEFLSAPAGNSEVGGELTVTVKASSVLSFLESFSVAIESEGSTPAFRLQSDHGPWGVLNAVREDTISLNWDTGPLPNGSYRIVATARSVLDGEGAAASAAVTGLRVNRGQSQAPPGAGGGPPVQLRKVAVPRGDLMVGRIVSGPAPPPEEALDPVAADPEAGPPEATVLARSPEPVLDPRLAYLAAEVFLVIALIDVWLVLRRMRLALASRRLRANTGGPSGQGKRTRPSSPTSQKGLKATSHG